MEYLMLKAKECFLAVLNRRTFVFTLIKINIAFFGRRIEKMLYLMGQKKQGGIPNMLKMR